RPAMVGTPPRAGRRGVRPGQDPCRGRRPAGRVGADRQPLACALACWRGGGEGAPPPPPHPPPPPPPPRPPPPGAGTRPRRAPAERARIRRVLDRGPVAAEFDNDLWTLARIAEVIERTTGGAHHPGHVWRILKAMR